MWQIENKFKVRIGGNTYIDTANIIVYKGKPLFSLRRHEDGYLGIDFEIYDAEGSLVATVKRNEIYLGNKDDYQIDGTYNSYTLTEVASGNVLCQIKKRGEAHPAELEVSVQLYTPSGFLFNASPDTTNFGGIQMTDCTFVGGAAAIAID